MRRAHPLRPVRVTAHIASLKWSQPHYAEQLQRTHGKEIDYARRPSEDFASLVIEFETDEGQTVIGEATTSWSFVGAGLRVSAELLGPEYSMSWNTLDSGLKLFFSRAVQAPAGEDLVEKQNAETGLMPVVANEAAAYGYENEDRHFVRAFLGKEAPRLTFEDGLEVVKLLMAAYQSAEEGRTLAFPPPGLDRFVPAVARGTWRPYKLLRRGDHVKTLTMLAAAMAFGTALAPTDAARMPEWRSLSGDEAREFWRGWKSRRISRRLARRRATRCPRTAKSKTSSAARASATSSSNWNGRSARAETPDSSTAERASTTTSTGARRNTSCSTTRGIPTAAIA